MNTQKPEARLTGDPEIVDFHSMFFTIQGEGPFSGHRSIFVRLAGCNLQCPGCDTEYTEGRELRLVRGLAARVSSLANENGLGKCLVVLTGGEPFRQQTGKLVEQISLQGHHVQIESNGMLEPDSLTIEMLRYGYASLIVSPKTGRIHDTCRGFAMAFKYVLDHRSVDPMDGLPIEALGHKAPARGVARPREGVPVYVNPFDSGDPLENELNLLAAANSALKYGYIVGVQLHKLIGLA